MVFSSSIFLLYFFPLFLLAYFVIPQKFQNYTILAFSLFFYAWGAPSFIFIVLASIVIDFYIVKAMSQSAERKRKRFFLGCSVVLNLGLLLYFKYANFFVDNVNSILSQLGVEEMSWTEVLLPVGISFFTFQKFTYGVDVYRGTYHPLKKVTDLAVYILMFPHLIAGPIVRFHEIAAQIETQARHISRSDFVTGFFRLCLGLGRKVLIANPLGEKVDLVFASDLSTLDPFTAWVGIIAYAMQIYFDFSGYSEMAIGMARMMGFRFPENFNNPYISQNITEFWRRWHMTLGRWMRDYLYIPLGGNRVGDFRLYFNLWIVFLISGLWHGAAWNFVIWGAFHGFFLVADRLFLIRVNNMFGKIPSIAITFFFTLVGWIIFRSESMNGIFLYLRGMFSPRECLLFSVFDLKFYIILVIALFFSFWGGFTAIERWQQKVFEPGKTAFTLVIMLLASIVFFVLSIGFISSAGFNPFIYFRF